MPIFVIVIALTALMVIANIALRSKMTFEAAVKKFEGDPNWSRYLGKGAIEDTVRDDAAP